MLFTGTSSTCVRRFMCAFVRRKGTAYLVVCVPSCGLCCNRWDFPRGKGHACKKGHAQETEASMALT